MELKSRSTTIKPAGGGHKPTTLIRLIYELEESRKLWIVDLPWMAGTSAIYHAKAESLACQKFLRIYGHKLARERIARMWNDYNEYRKEQS